MYLEQLSHFKVVQVSGLQHDIKDRILCKPSSNLIGSGRYDNSYKTNCNLIDT